MAIQELNLGNVRPNPLNVHSDSTTEPYSANQTNNEIIDSFKYNFRQLISPDNLNSFITGKDIILSFVNDFTISIKSLSESFNYGCLKKPIKTDTTHKYFSAYNTSGKGEGLYPYLTLKKADGNITTVPYRTTYLFSDIAEFNQMTISAGNSHPLVDLEFAPILIDLTEMFGAGNEPSTVKELQQYLVPNKYYPYGRNIEPSMYVVKKQLNDFSMVPSDTIDTLPITDYPIDFTAQANGIYSLRISVRISQGGDFRLFDAHLKSNGVNYPFSLIEAGSYNEKDFICYLPCYKGQHITATAGLRPTQFNIKCKDAKFIHTKELKL